MFDLGGPVIDELLAWAQATERGPAARRARVLRLLEPRRAWLERLPVVKVAGTNGKGSVCAMLSAVLHRDGRRPALFTSPHLVRVTERFRVDEREMEPASLERHAVAVLERARALVKEHGEALRPTFFEALLAVGLAWFEEQQAEVLVCEAGVGGAYDATSVLPGAWGALTTVGLDHQDVLGASLEAIAADKAGIVGPGACLVLGPRLPPDLIAVVAAHAPGVRLVRADPGRLRVLPSGPAAGAGCEVEVELPAPGEPSAPGPSSQIQADGKVAAKPAGACSAVAHARHVYARLPLIGPHQLDNFAVVVELARHLADAGVLRDLGALQGVSAARWPGRLEARAGPPPLLLDAAHNAEGLRTLAQALDGLVPYERRVLAFGLSSGKDAPACVALVPALAPAVYLVEGFYRARAVEEVARHLPAGTVCRGRFATPRALLEFAACEAHGALITATLVICGSIFLLGDILRALDASAPAPRSLR